MLDLIVTFLSCYLKHCVASGYRYRYNLSIHPFKGAASICPFNWFDHL